MTPGNPRSVQAGGRWKLVDSRPRDPRTPNRMRLAGWYLRQLRRCAAAGNQLTDGETRCHKIDVFSWNGRRVKCLLRVGRGVLHISITVLRSSRVRATADKGASPPTSIPQLSTVDDCNAATTERCAASVSPGAAELLESPMRY
jgi:hypothetical protein